MSKGRLVIVGTGLITPKHITQESINHIQAADRIYYITPDLLSADYLKSLNPNLVSLADCYQLTKNRKDTYQLMVERVMEGVYEGLNIVAIFYGHPGVFVTPSHDLITRAKAENIPAEMLPGISAEDCLFSDLGIDPGTLGCQSYEATYFLLNKINLNTASPTILWQLGVVGDLSFNTNIQPASNGLDMLMDKLRKYFDDTQSLIIYEAPEIPGFDPRAEEINLGQLNQATIKDISTLYIPPAHEPILDQLFIDKWQLAYQ